MKPSSDVVEGSGEDTLIGITIEDMVSTVEMLEWLEVGRKETERAHATSFFSRHLDYYGPLRRRFRQEWAKHLPNLVPLLTDCLPSHNSKAVQRRAILSLNHLLGSSYKITDEIVYNSAVPQLLIGLGWESDWPEILDTLARIVGHTLPFPHTSGTTPRRIAEAERYKLIDLGCLSLITNRISQYAAIPEPTETEVACLAAAITALERFCWPYYMLKRWDYIVKVLPAIASIFKEPGKRKEAQIQAQKLMWPVGLHLPRPLLESGIVKVLVETMRTGMENYPAFDNVLKGIRGCGLYRNPLVLQTMLDEGALDAFLQMFKHPEHMGSSRLWNSRKYIEGMWEKNVDGHRDAILNHPGLLEQLLELAVEKRWDTGRAERWDGTPSIMGLLELMTRTASNPQLRRLMMKESFLRVLGLYLSPSSWEFNQLACSLVRPCLEAFEMPREGPLRHRFFNGTGVTDALRRLADTVNPGSADARDILDTYFKDSNPPPAPSNLPTLIYTKNYPY